MHLVDDDPSAINFEQRKIIDKFVSGEGDPHLCDRCIHMESAHLGEYGSVRIPATVDAIAASRLE